MDFLFFTNKFLSLGTILSQIFLALVVIWFFVFRDAMPKAKKWFSEHGLLLAGITSFVATAASLFYSNVAGFPPCELCWFQRIFMYPIWILILLALLKKERYVTDYALTLAVIGFLISAFHNYVYYMNQGLNALCQVPGGGVSCIQRYLFEFGYVTIPLMALTAFVLIVTFLLISKQQKHG